MNKFKTMIIVAFIIGLILILFIIGKINLSIKFDSAVKELFSQSMDISNKRYSQTQLDGLPEPIQRYFNYILKDGQSYISYARIKHDGLFKADLKKGWMNITGEQYATTEKPGFIWKGTTQMFVAREVNDCNGCPLIQVKQN